MGYKLFEQKFKLTTS